jgi:hypothetical protein
MIMTIFIADLTGFTLSWKLLLILGKTIWIKSESNTCLSFYSKKIYDNFQDLYCDRRISQSFYLGRTNWQKQLDMAKWRGLIWKTNIDMMHLLWILNIWNKELDYWYRQLVLLKNKSHRPYVMFHLPYPYQKRPWWKIEPAGLDRYVDCRATKSSCRLSVMVVWRHNHSKIETNSILSLLQLPTLNCKRIMQQILFFCRVFTTHVLSSL